MAKLGTLLIDLALNSSRMVKELGGVNRRLDNFAKNTQRVARFAGAAFATIQVGGLAKDLVEVVDKYKLMEGRLKLVQREGESLAATQQKLFDLANRTRQGVGETVDFYTQLARATKVLNLDQQTLLDTTETINKAIIISGASAQSANAALFQLQQGLAAGALRGQELNSVLEQTPRVAEAIAEGMGVTIGQLRKLGEEGKLNAQAVINALKSQAQTLDDEFKEVPITVAQNMQLLTNEFENAAKGAGGFNKLINASITSLTNWARTYNAVFNPTAKEKLIELQDAYRTLNAQIMAGAFQGDRIKLEKIAELNRIEKELNLLNERVIVEQKLASIEQRRSDQKRTTVSNVVPIKPTDPISQADSAFGQEQGFYVSMLEKDAEAQEALLAQDRQWRQARIHQATEEKEALERLEKNRADSLLSSSASLFGSLAAIVGNGSKKQFELSKKLARAEVLISTYSSAQKAYEWASKFGGPAAGAAAAAAAIGAGLARLTAINRTSFTSSSAAAANSGAGSFVPAPSPTPVTPQTNAAQGQTFIIITGQGQSQISDSELDTLMGRISGAINEGSQVIIRRDSVQAQELVAAVG